MSDRGSWVSDYIYCEKCLAAARKILAPKGGDKWWNGIKLHGYPILAGKVGGLFPGDEIETFKAEILPVLNAVLCHPLRIVLLPENDDVRIVFAGPPDPHEDRISCQECGNSYSLSAQARSSL